MERNHHFFIKCAGAVVVVLMLAAGVSCTTTTADTAPATPVAAPAPDPPVRIACLFDKTRSTHWTRVEQVTASDLAPLVKLVAERGGELAVGLIRDKSNLGLLRLHIPQTPAAPIEPDPQQNPFLYAEQKVRYEADYGRYEQAVGALRLETEHRVSAFSMDLETLLARPADAGKTDVWGAILRAELFLNEPDNQWKPAPHKYAILISDGQDNVRGTAVEMNSGARILLVNGSASVGSLAALDPVRFESMTSAIQFVLSAEGN